MFLALCTLIFFVLAIKKGIMEIAIVLGISHGELSADFC